MHTLVEPYSREAALEIIDAYQTGTVDTSLELVAASGLEHVLAVHRRSVQEEFCGQAIADIRGLHDDAPTAVIVTGGVAAGKTTFITGLDSDRFYKPRGYRFGLPEYEAFRTYGSTIPVRRHANEGPFVADHAARFVHDERLRLKQQAIRLAGQQACSVAVECHPSFEDVTSLAATAVECGLQYKIFGLQLPLSIATQRALARSSRTRRPMTAFRLHKTHHAMSTEWPRIAALDGAELITP